MGTKPVNLPIDRCELSVSVGDEGVWLHFGKYATIHVHNVLGKGDGIIQRRINEWCIKRQAEAITERERGQE